VLSLAEQTTLLLYRGEVSADGTRMTDTFHRYGRSGSLVCAAVLMDLALRGRVAVERPLPPQERAKGEGCAIALLLARVVRPSPGYHHVAHPSSRALYLSPRSLVPTHDRLGQHPATRSRGQAALGGCGADR
jgi:hypothetical protein